MRGLRGLGGGRGGGAAEARKGHCAPREDTTTINWFGFTPEFQPTTRAAAVQKLSDASKDRQYHPLTC